MNKTSSNIILKKTLAIFLPFVILIIAVAVSITSIKNKSEFELSHSLEVHKANLMHDRILEELPLAISDLTILASLHEMEEFLGNTENQELIEHLNSYFLSLSKNRKVYDQVRLIDESGKELIRVNDNNGRTEIVPEQDLQNKKGRYYFDDAIKLNRDEVFVSPLDLNIEYGEIEMPRKPIIRFATPVFDQEGNKKGIVLLNFLGDRIIHHSLEHKAQAVESNTMLLNSDSYWLKGISADQEWGFMCKNGTEVKFSNYYAEEWEIIENADSSQFETEKG